MLWTTRIVCCSLLAVFMLGFAHAQEATKKVPASVGAPYLLDICAISGRPLPEDGGVVVVDNVHGDGGGCMSPALPA